MSTEKHNPTLVANKGYKRYLKAEKGAFAIDLERACLNSALEGTDAIAKQRRQVSA